MSHSHLAAAYGRQLLCILSHLKQCWLGNSANDRSSQPRCSEKLLALFKNKTSLHLLTLVSTAFLISHTVYAASGRILAEVGTETIHARFSKVVCSTLDSGPVIGAYGH